MKIMKLVSSIILSLVMLSSAQALEVTDLKNECIIQLNNNVFNLKSVAVLKKFRYVIYINAGTEESYRFESTEEANEAFNILKEKMLECHSSKDFAKF